MAIIRANKNKNYTVMSNVHLRDINLSFKAKGILSMILSLPDDWEYSIDGLEKISKEGRTAIRAALKELKDYGYLVVTKLPPSKENGGKYEYIYNIYEIPQTVDNQDIEVQDAEIQDTEVQDTEVQGVENQDIENQYLENQDVESQDVENHPLYKILNKQNTDKQNTEELNTDKQNTKAKRKKEERKRGYDEILSVVADSDWRELYLEYIKMRKLIKSPMTDKALTMLINRVNKLEPHSIERQKQMLETAIMNNWKSVYPIKDDTTTEEKEPKRYGGTYL